MNCVEKVVEKLRPSFNGSIPAMSDAMGIHRSTLHHAMARGRFSIDLQNSFRRIAADKKITIQAEELLNG
jgi:hypothetical protein